MRIEIESPAELGLGYADFLLLEQCLTQSSMQSRLVRRRRQRLAVKFLRFRKPFEQRVHVPKGCSQSWRFGLRRINGLKTGQGLLTLLQLNVDLGEVEPHL